MLQRSALQSFANIVRRKVRTDRKEAGTPQSLSVTTLTALHSNFQSFRFLSFRMSAWWFVRPSRLLPALANHSFKQTPQKVKLASRLFLHHLLVELSQLLLREGVSVCTSWPDIKMESTRNANRRRLTPLSYIPV